MWISKRNMKFPIYYIKYSVWNKKCRFRMRICFSKPYYYLLGLNNRQKDKEQSTCQLFYTCFGLLCTPFFILFVLNDVSNIYDVDQLVQAFSGLLAGTNVSTYVYCLIIIFLLTISIVNLFCW